MGIIKRNSALERKIFRLLASPTLISDRLLTHKNTQRLGTEEQQARGAESQNQGVECGRVAVVLSLGHPWQRPHLVERVPCVCGVPSAFYPFLVKISRSG